MPSVARATGRTGSTLAEQTGPCLRGGDSLTELSPRAGVHGRRCCVGRSPAVRGGRGESTCFAATRSLALLDDADEIFDEGIVVCWDAVARNQLGRDSPRVVADSCHGVAPICLAPPTPRSLRPPESLARRRTSGRSSRPETGRGRGWRAGRSPWPPGRRGPARPQLRSRRTVLAGDCQRRVAQVVDCPVRPTGLFPGGAGSGPSGSARSCGRCGRRGTTAHSAFGQVCSSILRNGGGTWTVRTPLLVFGVLTLA